MNKKIRLIIVNDNQESLSAINKILEPFEEFSVIGEARNGQDALEMILKYKPDIVVMDIEMPVMDGFQCALRITQTAPYIGIILTGIAESVNVIRRGMQCGASDFIDLPLSATRLRNSILSLYSTKQQQRKHLIDNPLVVPKRQPKIVSVFSSKGGVGKTVLATNLATALRKETREDILLLDLDLQFGDVADLLNINPKISIVDLIADKNDIDVKELKNYVIKHDSGIRMLAAPKQPEQADKVTQEDAKEILTIFKEAFDYIIIDLPPLFSDVTLGAIEVSDEVILVTTMEIPTLKNIKSSLDILYRFQYPREKITLVINRFNNDQDIKVGDIQKFLGIDKIICVNENSELIRSSINMGEPLVLRESNTEVERQMMQICKSVMGYKEVSVVNKKVKESLFHRIFKGRG